MCLRDAGAGDVRRVRDRPCHPDLRHRSVRAHRLFHGGTTTGANGEVAAAGYADPIAVVDGWMDEASGADGHRRNLTDQGITSNTMGYGHSQGGCFSTFDVSDRAT